MFRTHLAFGFLIGLLTLNLLDIKYQIIFVLLVMTFSSLPDIDHPKSKLGRILIPISIIINLIFKHRKFFHSLFIPLILFILFKYLNLEIIAFPIAIGYISHLMGDSITKEGIAPLYPLFKFRIRGPIKTGKFLENILLTIIMVINLVYIAYLIKLSFFS
ncbi:metal-dependent hydrolase [Candidatus Woesearchaeota archaeon]|nr:metal-dependent hydrolase [Candidatus Woesearchaeota archaeon]